MSEPVRKWLACVGRAQSLHVDGKRVYFPHVHLGERDCNAPRPGHYLTINESGSIERCDEDALIIAAAPDLLMVCERFMADPDGPHWNMLREALWKAGRRGSR